MIGSPSFSNKRNTKQTKSPQPKPRIPKVVFQPETQKCFRAGANLLIRAVEPTLGPVARNVAVSEIFQRGKPPELLDDGATIARRIIQLPQRGQDVGAMYVRQMLWSLHKEIGDGSATAAVLFRTLYNEGLRHISNGGNPMILRRHIEHITPLLLNHIDAQTTKLAGKEQLALLAETICHDSDLAKILGEIFDIVGEFGRVEIRSGTSSKLERTYTTGMSWKGGLVSRSMLEDHSTKRTLYENSSVLLTDIEIDDPKDLATILSTSLRAGISHLMIVAPRISDRALEMSLMKSNREILQAIVVKNSEGTTKEQQNCIEDLAILTGATPVLRVIGDKLNKITIQNFGRARRAWANYDYFGIVGGNGNPRKMRSHIANLRTNLLLAKDETDQTCLRARIGKFMGGIATLTVGDHSAVEIHARKKLAERTALAIRGAINSGVVPGGGVVLLNCRKILGELMVASDDEIERTACRMLITTLEAPTRAMLTNAGLNSSEIMSEINMAGTGYGFDILGNKLANMNACGLYDASSVIRKALSSAIHSAALALTVDVIVHRKFPPDSYTNS